ncbi:ABC transporter permease [Pseudoalteromonas piscicida]|uniref:ABC transporter permease n=1 Tax=Pseudoalteromonas piscicida TaxID=43662 RepID=UPI000E35B46B|nr:ABC transporter permease [Pseudoalteromonas piscicida]AXQ99424.1 permease [Pseudoalteromonas piscicida]
MQAFNLGRLNIYHVSVVTTLSCVFVVMLVAMGMLHSLYFSPLPYPDAERIVKLEYPMFDENSNESSEAFNYPSLMHLYEHKPAAIEQLAMVHYAEQLLTSDADAPQIESAYVSPEWFSIFDMPLAMGRVITESVDESSPVAVLSFQAWQSYFNGDPNILNKTLRLDEQEFTIVGVAAEQFYEPNLKKLTHNTAVWLPWQYNLTSEEAKPYWWNRYALNLMVGKLVAGAEHEQVSLSLSNEMNTLWRSKVSDSEYFAKWHIGIRAVPLKSIMLGKSPLLLFGMLVVSLGLLGIALLNISNLYLARLSQIQRRLAIQAVVGAKTRDIALMQWSPLLALCFVSLVIATGASYAICQWLQRELVGLLPQAQLIALTWQSVLALGLVALLTSWLLLLAGVSAIRFRHLTQMLKQSGKGTAVVVSARVQRIMAVSQLSISIILLFFCFNVGVAAISHLKNAYAVDLKNKYEVTFYAPDTMPRDEYTEVMRQASEALANTAEVIAVSRSRSPIGQGVGTWSLQDVDTLERVHPVGRVVDSDYLEFFSLPLLQGQFFDSDAVRRGEQQLIINKTFAEQLGGEEKAIGKRLSFNIADEDAAFEIIAVVADLAVPGEPALPYVYRAVQGNNTLLIKTQLPVTKANCAELLTQVHPALKIFSFTSLAAQREQYLLTDTLVTYGALFIFSLTLLLIIVGLIGVFRYSQSLKIAYYGTKMVLGAKHRDLTQEDLIILFKHIGIALIISLLGCLLLSPYFQQVFNFEVFFVVSAGVVLVSSLCMYFSLQQILRRPLNALINPSEFVRE